MEDKNKYVSERIVNIQNWKHTSKKRIYLLNY